MGQEAGRAIIRRSFAFARPATGRPGERNRAVTTRSCQCPGGAGHLKKVRCVLNSPKEVKYAVIDAHRNEFSVKSLCRVLDISRSLYYAFKQARPSLRSQQDLALRARIVAINTAHRWAPGAVKMWHLLKAEGIQCGKHRVIRLRNLGVTYLPPASPKLKNLKR